MKNRQMKICYQNHTMLFLIYVCTFFDYFDINIIKHLVTKKSMKKKSVINIENQSLIYLYYQHYCQLHKANR